jgi:hypothetical protein
MKCWSEFAAEKPAMAEAGYALLYQFRVGLGYLATVRKDGGSRVHPVCPVIAHDGLYVFIGNHSPKVHDLFRDGRFALHAFPHPEVDDEFYVSGRAQRIDDAMVRQVVYAAYTATGAFTSNDTLFVLWLERAPYMPNMGHGRVSHRCIPGGRAPQSSRNTWSPKPPQHEETTRTRAAADHRRGSDLRRL